ncbi:MAG: hypothetical protein DRP83_00545 [Planctomycetota bacterium]|nr:MAG: hypothetical protein DRP83_00545 [Planctomycetota bacterium]
MQTFLPYPNYVDSAACLDNKRLGKQRVEAKQIHDHLSGFSRSDAWRNHPAVLMWTGYENALLLYYCTVVKEWIRRGFENNMPLYGVPFLDMPPWHGYQPFHASHRSNLLRKDPIHYMIFGWEEPDDLPYYWPSSCDRKTYA